MPLFQKRNSDHPQFSLPNLLPIAVGLIMAQLIGTLFVRRSNLQIHAVTQFLTQERWLPLPAGPAADGLMTWSAALGGGLFFTLSIGAILTLGTWAIVRWGQRCFSGQLKILYVLAIIWTPLLWLVNSKGFLLYPTLFVFCVPLATGITTTLWMRPQADNPKEIFTPIIVLIILTALWAPLLKSNMFIAIRDNLLLTSNVGNAVNDFYYRYTLYAAETFKSFDKKTIRTVDLTNIKDNVLFRRFKKTLLHYDILPAENLSPVDLAVSIQSNRLILQTPNGKRIDLDLKAFWTDPDKWLKHFSIAADQYVGLRHLTFWGVLLGFPILLYLSVFGLCRWLISLVFSPQAATHTSAGICFFIGLLLLIPIEKARGINIDNIELETALSSKTWQKQVAALQQIEKQKIEIAHLPTYKSLVHSPVPAVRYHLARALAISHNPMTYKDLLTMLNDSHPNVLCQTYYALGRRGNPAVIKRIITHMKTSDHWYAQGYAYRALRGLGWRQRQLK